MEQKFNNNRLDLQILREFCEREGEVIAYRKGDQMEREGDPARWFAFVTEGCFKYVKYGMSDDKAHITWFSFEGELVSDFPYCRDGDMSEMCNSQRVAHFQRSKSHCSEYPMMAKMDMKILKNMFNMVSIWPMLNN